MVKTYWIGGMAVVLLWAASARADDPPKGTDVQVGPVRVQVLTEAKNDEAKETPGKRVQVYVQRLREPGQAVVEIQTAPLNVQVHPRALGAAPIHVVGPIKLGDYWIGLGCAAAGDALRSQLGLEEGQGLVVESVIPDTPAAKAGIQRHDVLIKAGDKPLGGLPDLLDAVEAAKENELTLELIRGGKSRKIAVTPAKRPEEQRQQPWNLIAPGQGDYKRLGDWLHELRPGDATMGPMQFRFFHPPAILPPGAAIHPPLPGSLALPGNLSVTITKQGDTPAQIVVKRGDEKWEVSEGELDKLPEDVRGHVQRMLGGGRGDRLFHNFRGFDFVPNLGVPVRPDDQLEDRPEFREVPRGPLEKRMEKRMEDMNRRMEELRKSVDELRKNRSSRRVPKDGEAFR